MKRICCLILCALLLVSLCPASHAENPRRIATAADFLAFAEGCALESYSLGRVFSLEADIDLGGRDFEGVPFFAGTFRGNGHTVAGLSIRCDGSRLGLFRTVAEGAELRDLNVSGEVRPGGTRLYIGGLAGVNAGQIDNCSFSGSVAGLENVGGLVGLNEETGLVSACRFEGEVRGEHQVGGAAGVNLGTLEDCLNRGGVNNAAITPERKPGFDLAAFTEDDFLDLANIGGLAGDNGGVLRGCRNEGAVGYARTGYNVGGLAGRSSGFITLCENSGPVRARRDAGGVVGQLIPHTVWDFSEDRLQGLSTELDRLDALLDSLERGAVARAQAVREKADALRGAIADARDALAGVLSFYGGGLEALDPISLLPQEGMQEGPDLSALLRALTELQQRAQELSDALGANLEALPEDFAALQEQLARVRVSVADLLGGLSGEKLVESFDLSADESYEHENGAVDACVNRGSVESESSAGGVAGSMAFELSFDSEDRLNATDFLGANAKRYLFAAVRGCESSGAVTAQKDAAGGIVGRCELGAVTDCAAAGEVRSVKGDYVGGVAGSSDGTIRACRARVLLAGGKYVGGVAGSGCSLIDCAAWAGVTRADEYRGAIAGYAAGEVRGNRYVPGPPAGVDGVSRVGECEEIALEDFLALEGVPESFRLLELRFVVEGKTVETRQIPFGGSVGALPEVPNDGARYWVWDEPDEARVYRDLTITGRYVAPLTVIATGESPPLCLAEGQFYEGQQLQLLPYEGETPAGGLITAGTALVEGYDGALTLRLRAGGGGTLWLRGETGWAAAEYEVDKSYLVFTLENGGSFAYLAAERLPGWLPWVCGGAGAAVILAVILLARKKRKARSASA